MPKPLKRKDSRGRILQRGELQRSDGRYEFRYTDEIGVRHSIYSWRLTEFDKTPYGKKSQLPLRAMEEEIFRKREMGLAISRDLTVLELCQKYLDLKGNIRRSTKTLYEYHMEVLKEDVFGHLKVQTVKISDTKAFVLRLSRERKIGYGTIKNLRSMVAPAFQMALEDDIIAKNPWNWRLANVITNDTKTRDALSEYDMNRFLDYLKDSEKFMALYDILYILFHTGLRISEFCGLTLHDIDLEKKLVTVNKQLLVPSGKRELYCEATKTKAGCRIIPITDEVCGCFARIIMRRPTPAVEPSLNGVTGFILLRERKNGTFVTDSQLIRSQLHNALKKYNDAHSDAPLPNITPHICRHTFCTNMLRAGLDIKAVQYMMGHENAEVTFDVYSHYGLDACLEAIRRMKKYSDEEK